ncbi:iron dicitrate transporter FecR [Nitrospira sp. KM1]|nr:iron dicitrate transporter FecR [Nitrospira sp. KM1]
MSEAEHQELAKWREDSAHELEFRQAELFWNALDGLGGQVSRPITTVLTGQVRPAAKAASYDPSRTRFGSWRRFSLAAAAMVLTVVLVSVLWSAVDFWLSDYRTYTGEQTSVALADGSTVYLNTQSALSVDLSASRRALVLKRGEALFEVAHDPSRPFDVSVNGVVVRAVGTTFNIDAHGKMTAVSVIEGAVRLVDQGAQYDIPAGYRLAYESGSRPGAIEPISPPKVTAWRQHEFLFDDMPLDKIVAQLNRYRSGAIVVMDSKLRSQRLTGSIALDNPEHSLKMLQQVLPFHVRQVTPYLTLISS